MKRWLARLLPRRNHHLVLARTKPESATAALREGVTFSSVTTPQGPAFDMLEAFCAAVGFGNGWVAAMLECGACGTVVTQDGVPMAMGWSISAPFRVEEIRGTLDVVDGTYLFGDFVGLAYRGTGLQRLLVEHRLNQLTAPTAYTLIHPDNTPSFHSYSKAGFEPIGQIENRRWLGWETLRARSADSRYILTRERKIIRVRGVPMQG